MFFWYHINKHKNFKILKIPLCSELLVTLSNVYNRQRKRDLRGVANKKTKVIARDFNARNDLIIYISFTLCMCMPKGISDFSFILKSSFGVTSLKPCFLSSGNIVLSAL